MTYKLYFILLSDGSYGDPETILNENELLERYSHVDITKIKMSPSGKVGIFLWCSLCEIVDQQVGVCVLESFFWGGRRQVCILYQSRVCSESESERLYVYNHLIFELCVEKDGKICLNDHHRECIIIYTQL